ncbi:MAG: hypothetical protein JWM56_1374 [Candidatus Peribacteria bacterium]|nr:hypothetical protein [Candidatus Peribacteria bacterium]
MTFNEMQSEVIAVEDLSRHQVFITTKEYHDEKEDRMKPVTLESLRDPATRNPVSWVIHRATVKNDADLDILFKKEFGVTCSVGEKSSLEQQGIYRIQLNGDGKSRGETQCDPGDRLQLIYVPEKQELFYWIMGNGITFEEGTNSDSKTYDKDMRNSFHVL